MSQNLTEKSYLYLRQKLASGVLMPGQRLVNRTLANEIGVSVIPVREAIHRLASEGLIEHVPGAGAYVRKPSRQDLDNLYVLRDALESCAAAEAARYISEDQLEELELILERAKVTVQKIKNHPKKTCSKRQFDQWLDDEQYFHQLLIEASRNPLLCKVVEDQRAISNIFEAQRNDPQLLTLKVAEETCSSKAELLDALRKRDSIQAKEIMSAQIQRGRRLVIEFLKKQLRDR